MSYFYDATVTQVTFSYKHTSENDLAFPWGLSWQEKRREKKREKEKDMKLLYFPTWIIFLLDSTFQSCELDEETSIKSNWPPFSGTFFLKGSWANNLKLMKIEINI